jgi:hypothetical protein
MPCNFFVLKLIENFCHLVAYLERTAGALSDSVPFPKNKETEHCDKQERLKGAGNSCSAPLRYTHNIRHTRDQTEVWYSITHNNWKSSTIPIFVKELAP